MFTFIFRLIYLLIIKQNKYKKEDEPITTHPQKIHKTNHDMKFYLPLPVLLPAGAVLVIAP